MSILLRRAGSIAGVVWSKAESGGKAAERWDEGKGQA
jgi:hypothetical protein